MAVRFMFPIMGFIYIRYRPWASGLRHCLPDMCGLLSVRAFFFYAGGIFYTLDEASKEYVVADPPVGAIVSQLPSDAVEIEIDGTPYMEYNGIIYKPVTIDQPGYEVVGKLDE